MATQDTTQSSEKPPNQAQSRPLSEASASPADTEMSTVKRQYYELPNLHALFDHPEHEGFRFGRKLAKQYPEKPQKVIRGFRAGAKAGRKAAERRGGASC